MDIWGDLTFQSRCMASFEKLEVLTTLGFLFARGPLVEIEKQLPPRLQPQVPHFLTAAPPPPAAHHLLNGGVDKGQGHPMTMAILKMLNRGEHTAKYFLSTLAPSQDQAKQLAKRAMCLEKNEMESCYYCCCCYCCTIVAVFILAEVELSLWV